MKEQPHAASRPEKQEHPIARKVADLARSFQEATKDVLMFAFEPIAFEFRRMREEAEKCAREIEKSALDPKEKRRLQERLSEAMKWLEAAREQHYNNFSKSLPVIEVRHQFVKKLKKIESDPAMAA